MTTLLLAVASGVVVGFVLGFLGGGGSILAVPLLVHVVGVASPHVAIGTSAVAVAASAAITLAVHSRTGNVKWRCAALFAMSGVLGAAAGAQIGLSIDGQRLLALFGGAMIVVGLNMLRQRRRTGNASVRLCFASASSLVPRLVAFGFAAGVASGLFGIGGGFLIVPGLVLATDMPLVNAVGSSLVGVAAFGATTATTYASAGLVDWPLALAFVGAGVLGGVLGSRLTLRVARHQRALAALFAGLIVTVGVYVMVQGLAGAPTST